jgi:hypothetical protein
MRIQHCKAQENILTHDYTIKDTEIVKRNLTYFFFKVWHPNVLLENTKKEEIQPGNTQYIAYTERYTISAHHFYT